MLRTAQNRRSLQESAPDGPPVRRPAPQKGGQHLLYRLIIQQWAVFRNKKADTTLKKRHPFLRGRLFSCARGAGGAGRSAAALVNADVVGTATAAFQVAAAFVVAVDIRLGRGRLVVGGNVAVPLAVAVAAADSVPGAGMADVDAVQAAAARLVVTAVILGTVKIAHKNTSMSLSMRRCGGVYAFYRAGCVSHACTSSRLFNTAAVIC